MSLRAHIFRLFLTILFIGVLGFVLYGLLAPFLADTCPAIVQQKVDECESDSNRPRSTRDSGEIPKFSRRGSGLIQKFFTSESDGNLQTYKASDIKVIARDTGVELYNFIERDNGADIYLYATDRDTIRRFTEQLILVGEINSFEQDFGITDHSEPRGTIHLATVRVGW